MMYGLKLNGSMQPWYGGAVLWLPHSFVDFSTDVSFVGSL